MTANLNRIIGKTMNLGYLQLRHPAFGIGHKLAYKRPAAAGAKVKGKHFCQLLHSASPLIL
ncbi:hypothetical protein D3C71_2223380 [compost metagenome]